MGERAKKGSPTSTLHDRHCCGILSWTTLEIEPYEVSCLSVISTRRQPEVIRKKVHVSIERNTILCVRYIFYIKISQIRRGNEKVFVSSHNPSITLLYQSCTNWQWKPVNEIKFSLPLKINALYTLTPLEWKGRTNLCRLRVFPLFPSGIVERAKSERTWKSSNARKATRRGEREMRDYRQSPSLSSPRLAFLTWDDFHPRSRFARSTILEGKWGTTRSLQFL